MATQVETLIVELDAKVTKYIQNLEKANKQNKKTSDGLVNIDKKSKSATASMFKFSNVAIAVSSVLGLRVFTNFSDQVQIADNQLKNVTETTEEYNLAATELNRIAIETRQNVSELTSVYARFSRAGKDAGFTQREILELTESLTKAFKIEGNTTAEVNSTLLQLTQSFRSGRIAGEEFRSVSESSTLVLQALAKQMQVNVGDLKKMAAEGLVTPRALIEGLKKVGPEVNKQFANLAPTFAEVGAVWGTAAASGYKDSFIEDTASFIKSFAVDAAKGFEVIFSTPVGADALTKKITEVAIKLSELQNSGSFSPLLGPQISILESRLASLREELEKVQKEPLEIIITDGIEDPRIQQEKDFIDAINELNAENVTTIEERFLFDIAANKAALDAKLINVREFHKQQEAIAKGFAKDQENLDKVKNKNRKDNFKLDEKHAMQGMQLAALVFEDNKLISSGIAFVNTAQGVTKALAVQDYAGATLTALIGAAQIASINSASKGGGAISSAGGGGSISSSQSQQQDFQPETSSLELTEQSETSNVTRFIMVDDAGNDIAEFVTGKQEENARQGR